jgi:hypothetical protein
MLAELSVACAAPRRAFCTYHSIMDWHHPDYLPRRRGKKDAFAPTAPTSPLRAVPARAGHRDDQRYHPAVMWFDGEWESTWTHERGVRLFDLCRALAPRCSSTTASTCTAAACNGFSGSRRGGRRLRHARAGDPRDRPAGRRLGVVHDDERPLGLQPGRPELEETETLLRNLIDIASKGGNYLLNVGPRADGTFPPLKRSNGCKRSPRGCSSKRRSDPRHDGECVRCAAVGPLHGEGRTATRRRCTCTCSTGRAMAVLDACRPRQPRRSAAYLLSAPQPCADAQHRTSTALAFTCAASRGTRSPMRT